MTTPAHKTEGANRTKNVRVYPFVFTGKERDEETGYGYFGARYMDHELMTMWLSVDPMTDKYPSISPYNYCMWNPIKLVDPDGMDTIFSLATNTNNTQVNVDNLKILKFARHEGNIPGVTSIAMHGSDNGQRIYMSDASGASEIPLNSDLFLLYIDQHPIFDAPDYKSSKDGTPVFILYSCHSGEYQDSFAEQLSRKTNGLVIAPNGTLFVNPQGSCYIEDSSGKPNGVWNVFCNGEFVTSFSGTQPPKDWISNKGGVSNVINSL